VDIFGRVRVLSSQLKVRPHTGFTMEAELETIAEAAEEDRVSILWIEEREKGKGRHTSFECTFGEGETVKESLSREWEQFGSFAVDLCKFVHRVQDTIGGKSAKPEGGTSQEYNPSCLVTHCVEVAEQITSQLSY